MIPTMPGRLYTVIGRFTPDLMPRFKAATLPDAPTRLTPAAAIRDELTWRQLKGDI